MITATKFSLLIVSRYSPAQCVSAFNHPSLNTRVCLMHIQLMLTRVSRNNMNESQFLRNSCSVGAMIGGRY